MKVSVIIPYLNAAGTVGSTLDALVEQSWPSEWEVIIADNGSTDALGPIVARYKTQIPSLKVIDASAKRGAAYARNVAVRASTGDRILFCDADDVPGCGWATVMALALHNHHFVAARIELQKLNPPSITASRGGTQTDGLQTCHFLPFPHAGGGSIGISRHLHDGVGGFDETILLGEDADYCMRVQLTEHKLVFVPDAVLHMRLRATQTGTFVQASRYAKHIVYLYKHTESDHFGNSGGGVRIFTRGEHCCNGRRHWRELRREGTFWPGVWAPTSVPSEAVCDAAFHP